MFDIRCNFVCACHALFCVVIFAAVSAFIENEAKVEDEAEAKAEAEVEATTECVLTCHEDWK